MSNEAEAPLVDTRKVEHLRALLADQFEAQLTGFLSNSERYLHAMDTALREGRYADAFQEAHKLYSSSGQYGLLRLSAMARRMERGDSAKPEGLLDLSAAMQDAFRQAQARLADFDA